jgi:4,5-DOPA dioxygenase extradiol
MADRPRAIFISHGSPNLILHNTSARGFLAGYGEALGRPRAAVVATAHWVTPAPSVSAAQAPETIYDFGGFEPELYEMKYPAPGAPDIARGVAEKLASHGLDVSVDATRGYDHGVWVPLMLLWPDADVPVVPLSVQPRAGAAHHLAVGRALAGLADEDVLVIGSGVITHNLRAIFANIENRDAPRPKWVGDFTDWIHAAATEGREGDLVAWRTKAPYARENHPTEEHLLPFFIALGAGGEGTAATRVHESHEFGALQMDAYAFG